MSYKWAESINTGELNRRVLLQSEVHNAEGDEVTGYTDIATVWGSVEPLRGREFLEGEARMSEVNTRIRIRYRSGLDSAKRAKVGTTEFDVISVINPHASNRVLELMCKTVQ